MWELQRALCNHSNGVLCEQKTKKPHVVRNSLVIIGCKERFGMTRPTTDVVNKILSAIGKGVRFKYPGNEGQKQGVLKDRAVVESTNAFGAVPYWDVVDLIEFKGEEEPEWIRIGYYRTPQDRLQWASQTTITEPVSVWKRILVNAAREKAWFRDLLEGVMKELSADCDDGR
jgi:hypothetical protein